MKTKKKFDEHFYREIINLCMENGQSFWSNSSRLYEEYVKLEGDEDNFKKQHLRV